MAQLSARPSEWLGRKVRLDGLADIQLLSCNTMVCDCCRQCSARVSLRDGELQLELTNVECSVDLCGGACLLQSWDQRLTHLEGVNHKDAVTVWGGLREVPDPASPSRTGYAFEVDAFCATPSH